MISASDGDSKNRCRSTMGRRTLPALTWFLLFGWYIITTYGHGLRYNSLGIEQYPDELIPNVAADGHKSLTPFGDRKAVCCSEPAEQVQAPHLDVDSDEPTDPRVFAVVAAIEEGEPAALRKALKAIENAPERIKAEVKAALDAMKNAANLNSATPSPSSSVAPSPSVVSKRSETHASNATSPSSKEKVKPFSSIRKYSRMPFAPASAPAPAPTPAPTPAPAPTPSQARSHEHSHSRKKTTSLSSSVSDFSEAAKYQGRNADPEPVSVAFGQSVPTLVSPGNKALFKLQMPPDERAPLNLHFTVTFRDVPMRGCQHIVMRLRKFCGDRETSPGVCDYPIMSHFSTSQGVPGDVVREKSSSAANMTSIDSLGKASRLEWYEENPYTRKISLKPGFDCGCERHLGEEEWARRGDGQQTWWVEIANEDNNGDYSKILHTNLACDFMFRVHAVDICSGHGDYLPGVGCKCDAGYSGQYRGPVSMTATPGETNNIINMDLLRSQHSGIVGLGSNKNQGKWASMLTEAPHVSQNANANAKSGSLAVALVRETIARATKEHPIESAPGETGGIFGEQDNHQLGCSQDERSPIFDPVIQKHLQIAKQKAEFQVSENSEISFDTDQISLSNSSDFRMPKPPILGKMTPKREAIHDDCSGTLTVNTISVMSDNEIIACTGRSREEIMAGSMYADRDANAAARVIAEKVRGDLLDNAAWAPNRSQKIVLGDAAASQLALETKQGHDGEVVQNVSSDVPPVTKSYRGVEMRMGLGQDN